MTLFRVSDFKFPKRYPINEKPSVESRFSDGGDIRSEFFRRFDFSQTAQPELGIAGFRLGGDEAATKTKLQGYSPRYDNERGQPKYFFYNEYGNQVMAITCYSKERPFLVVGIEVFAVGESYQNKHFQMKGVNSFVSESGFYIGEKPSAKSLIFAVPNVTGAKDVIKKLGTPKTDEKADKNARTLIYQLNNVKDLPAEDGVNFGAYTAQFKFVKNHLRRFSLALETPQTAKIYKFRLERKHPACPKIYCPRSTRKARKV